MYDEIEPIVHQWYQRTDTQEEFTVVAIDESNDLIEVQDFNGEIDELSFDAWLNLPLELIEPPEDWRGPLDELEDDDFGLNDDFPSPTYQTRSNASLSIIEAGDAGLGGWED